MAEGVTYFDFTIGFHPYKLELGAAEEVLFEFSEALTLRGAIVLGTTGALRRVKATVRRHSWLYKPLRATRSAWRRVWPCRAR